MNEKYNRILINIIHNKMENLDRYYKRVYNIFNKCSVEVQIDFIKLLFIQNKETLYTYILNITNINTVKELLKYGFSNNNIALIYYVLTNKDVKLESDFYYSLEKLAKNQYLIDFIETHRIKDVYQVDNRADSDSNYDSNNSSSNYDTDITDTDITDSNSDSSSIFSSDLDKTDNDEDEDEEDYKDIKYGKHINPKDVIEVD